MLRCPHLHTCSWPRHIPTYVHTTVSASPRDVLERVRSACPHSHTVLRATGCTVCQRVCSRQQLCDGRSHGVCERDECPVARGSPYPLLAAWPLLGSLCANGSRRNDTIAGHVSGNSTPPLWNAHLRLNAPGRKRSVPPCSRGGGWAGARNSQRDRSPAQWPLGSDDGRSTSVSLVALLRKRQLRSRRMVNVCSLLPQGHTVGR